MRKRNQPRKKGSKKRIENEIERFYRPQIKYIVVKDDNNETALLYVPYCTVEKCNEFVLNTALNALKAKYKPNHMVELNSLTFIIENHFGAPICGIEFEIETKPGIKEVYIVSKFQNDLKLLSKKLYRENVTVKILEPHYLIDYGVIEL